MVLWYLLNRATGRKLSRSLMPSLVLTVALGCSSDEAASPNPEDGAGGGGSQSCNDDGDVDTGEECDGTVPSQQTCASFTSNARPNGTLKCVDCKIDDSGCTKSSSGSGGSSTGTGGAQTGTGAASSSGGTSSGGSSAGTGGA